VLLERRATAASLLQNLESAFHARVPLAIATVLEGPEIARRFFAGPTAQNAQSLQLNSDSLAGKLQNLATTALECTHSLDQPITVLGHQSRIWVDYRAARPGLWIFGAGDDAKPLLRLARELGWYAAVADGRSHLATRERFSAADKVLTLPIDTLPKNHSLLYDVKTTDAAVLVTHSFEQDARILATLLSREVLPAYLGVLGPQRRTREVLAEAARLLGLPNIAERAEQWLAQLHAPTGLDLGAETPATIALSIVAEIQQTLNNASALPLRQVRAVLPAMSRA